MRLHNNFGRFFITLKLALLQAIILVRISCQKVVKSKFWPFLIVRQILAIRNFWSSAKFALAAPDSPDSHAQPPPAPALPALRLSPRASLTTDPPAAPASPALTRSHRPRRPLPALTRSHQPRRPTTRNALASTHPLQTRLRSGRVLI